MVIDFKSESSLIQAVFTCNLEEVKYLLSKRVDINHQSPNGKISALHIAAHCSGNFKLNKPQNDQEKENYEQEHKDYIEIVKLLCKSGARINLKDSKSLTALHYACRSNSYKAVEILLEHQADVNSRDKNWQAPLHICAMYNSAECARLILKNILNIDATDKQGRSSLAHASFNGNLEMVELLLENGANCNIHDKQERKPIHWASFMGYTDIISLLVKHGADVNSLDKDLYTPLLAACSSGKSEETVKLLIELGADTNATTIYDSSVFHLACLNGHEQIIKELLNTHYLSMNINSKGYHPLHYAASCKRGGFCVEYLISLEIDVNLTSYVDGKTPMHLSSLHGVTSSAQILFANGALVNVKDSDGNTPLHLAASNGQTSMLEFLVECGANIYIRGSNGMLPWAMAALNGHFECFKILEQIIPTLSSMKQFFETKDDFDRTFMHLAALSGNYECLYLFINADCDINQQDKYGNTPLHYACAGSYLKCVELLIRSGADVNEVNESLNGDFKDMNDFNIVGNGATPLMLACAFDQDGYVVRELMFSARARADLVDKNGFNTLHYAALQGNRNVFEIILDQCKNLDHQKNVSKISPLHILAYSGHRDALDFLLSNSFDPEVCEANGRTPLDLACYRGEILCVECLLSYGANFETHDFVNQRTPLHSAAYNNNIECLKILTLFSNQNENYKNEKLANLRDKFQRTPLMYSVEQGHLNTINFLISEMGADVLASDYKQRTALHRAAALGYEECCQAILKSNRKTAYQKDINGLLPIHYAIMTGHANFINLFFDYFDQNLNLNELLLDKDAYSLLHFACFTGHSSCIEVICELAEEYEFLVDMLFNNENSNSNKFSPIHFACHNSHDTCLNYLLDKYHFKLDILLELEDLNGNRPLHICAIDNEYDCASLLLEHNCDLNSKNKKGQTPFMLAASNNAFSIMELLVSDENSNLTQNLNKPKIDLSLVDNSGNSALHLALLNQHENCALFILDRIEANSFLINLKNKEGHSPLHLASSNGFLTVVEILLSKGGDIWSKNSKQQTPLLICAKNEQVADCLELLISKLLLSFSNKSIQNQAAHTPSFMMMMGQNASSALCSYRENRNLNNSINELNPNLNITKNLNTDSTYTLTTSDIILNDVNMNQLSNSVNIINENENNTKSNSNNSKFKTTNLNSTLILNENEIVLDSNVSSTVGSIEGLNNLNLNSTVNTNNKNCMISSSESVNSLDSEYY